MIKTNTIPTALVHFLQPDIDGQCVNITAENNHLNQKPMEKNILIQELKKISKAYFDKKDYISAGRINLAIDVIEDFVPPPAPETAGSN